MAKKKRSIDSGVSKASTPGVAASPSTDGGKGRDVFIEVRDLHKTLGNQEVHRGVDLTVYRGETMVLLGASGEGKSVFLKTIVRVNVSLQRIRGN